MLRAEAAHPTHAPAPAGARARQGCAMAAWSRLPLRRRWGALAVACRAVGPGLHVVLLFQLSAERELIALRLPGHAGDLLARSKKTLRRAVALEAPAHGQRLRLLHRGHLVDAAVAGDAADALLHVDCMVEVDEMWQLVDLVPDDGPVREVALTNRRELGALVPDLLVAIEAEAGRRNSRPLRLLHQIMAVATIDAFVADVMAMVELHRLIDRVLLLGEERSAYVNHRPGDETPAAQQREGEDRDPKTRVRGRLEECAHPSSIECRAISRACGRWYRSRGIVRREAFVAATEGRRPSSLSSAIDCADANKLWATWQAPGRSVFVLHHDGYRFVMAKTVVDFIHERMRAWGVTRVFGYPGDGINGITAGFEHAEARASPATGGARKRGAVEENESPRFIQARHEEMAAFMAGAHAKFTGEVGVCLATSGPGAIHLLNGLYDADTDHQPVVAIVGQTFVRAIGGD